MIPVLTYHAVNVIENTYEKNDHLALISDLRAIKENGWKIIPLDSVVAWHEGALNELDGQKVLALTFDDGSAFDFYELDHPTCGIQRGFINILRDFQNDYSLESGLDVHASSFVISSPEARSELDLKALIGKGWWGDEWWEDAQQTELVNIECHSWDHNHPALAHVAQENQIKGDFTSIKTYMDCDRQVAVAGDFIQDKLRGKRPSYFAYPWGQASDYMSTIYLPKYRHRHRFKAAFTTEPKPVSRDDCVWLLPRYVCGRDWNSPNKFQTLLENLAARKVRKLG